MVQSSALYFPTIEFRDEDFLRRSLLYWDCIYRIVPVDYTPNDTDFVKELQDAGMIKDIHPNYSTMETVANRLVDQIHSPFGPAGLHPNVYDLGAKNNELVGLHRTKIYYVLRDMLSEMGIPIDSKGFFKVNSEFAGYYMLMLARELSRSRRIPLATDFREIWDITPSFIDNWNISETGFDSDNKKCLTSMTIDGLFPAKVSNITASQLIQLAKDSRDARVNLRKHIGRVINKIQEIESEEQARDELRKLIEGINIDKKEFRKSLKFFNSDEFDTCLNLSIPTMATLFSLVPDSGIFKFGALVFAMIQFIRNSQKLKKNRDASYQAYLVGLDNKVASGIHYEIAQRTNEFIYD